ncbi:MAG: glucosidase [Planctomycetota bacterium]|nr:MAG: glucosidase [Planctomycetota bacterium]
MARTREHERLDLAARRMENWQRWGPYLSERQWGTVREDYSDNQDAWAYFPHDHARSRAYRWGEDGLLGLCDRECRLCFCFAFWNGRDPILKERLFGLSGPEGNHGEDVKECYYYLDSTPTHSYMQALYKYPLREFPYQHLIDENARRSLRDPEFELIDTGIFADGQYVDCQVEYAKRSPNDVLIRLQVSNRGQSHAHLHVLPQWWFRNTWTWNCTHEGCTPRPSMQLAENRIAARHATLGQWLMAVDFEQADPQYWFTENETNPHRHPGIPTTGTFYKDAFHRRLIVGDLTATNPRMNGTKVAGVLALDLAPGETRSVRARMCDIQEAPVDWFGSEFDAVFQQRRGDADEFYHHVLPANMDTQHQLTARTAYAGLLWSKQFYHYVVQDWIDGDANYPAPTEVRRQGRNHDWGHLFNRDVISMPDKWEYPWYAAWDLAFHMIPLARLDPEFAKQQLILFLREWYMHPNGAIPAYEWALSDVNPPVHAWACWNVYLQTKQSGNPDRDFLARTFQKLLLNFTWWVNRKDPDGHNVFSGGFLGLDNIGVFDRSKPMPTGGRLHQADATAWMAFYCGTMLEMALELAANDVAYADMASKFFEHYLAIANAMNALHTSGLWDQEDGFYCDYLHYNDQAIPLRVRSLVGLIPLCTPVLIEEHQIAQLPGFRKRMEWYLQNRSEMGRFMNYMTQAKTPEGLASDPHGVRLLALPSTDRLRRLLQVMLDTDEFLSPFGIRSLSARHASRPFVFDMDGVREEIRYVPGESDSYMFGGNSNWRGPIWFPINYLIIESLRKYHRFYGDSFSIECPTGSGQHCNLAQVADELERRLTLLFLPDASGHRPCHGGQALYRDAADWRDLVLLYEYFDGNTGRGLGASHQTGWTALVATMLENQARHSALFGPSNGASNGVDGAVTVPTMESPSYP